MFARILSILLFTSLGTTAVAQDFYTFHDYYNEAYSYYHVPSTTKPSGATTKWMQFWMKSNNFFLRSPASHFAVAARGELLFSGGVPSSALGRGITIGHTSGIPVDQYDSNRGGCLDYASLPIGSRPGQSQIESFWSTGNYVYTNTCRPFTGYDENTWYRVTIHVNDAHYIAFWIDDALGNRIDAGWEPVVYDGGNPVPTGLTGHWIVLGRGAGDLGNWSMEFSTINAGWF